MIRSSSHWRALLLLIPLLATTSAAAPTTCDMYSVELRASFENDAVVSCSLEEVATVEALIHSLVQTDAIVGLNRTIPVPAFFFASEQLGPNSTQQRAFAMDDTSNDRTQMEKAQAFLTVEDEVEELYYSAGGTVSRDEVEEGVDYKGDEELVKEAPPVKLTPPAPIDLAEGSLRSFPVAGGKHKRNLRFRTPDDNTPSTSPTFTDAPSDISSYAPSEIPSLAPSHSPSATPTITASDAPSMVPSTSPSSTPSHSPSHAPSYVPSEAPTVTVSDAPSHVPSIAPSSVPSATPSVSPSTTPSTTPSTDELSADLDCQDADWCAWFLTRPCNSIPHDAIEDAELQAFEQRVATQIERKLRKWARDTNVQCLGNSWELKAVVQRLL